MALSPTRAVRLAFVTVSFGNYWNTCYGAQTVTGNTTASGAVTGGFLFTDYTATLHGGALEVVQPAQLLLVL